MRFKLVERIDLGDLVTFKPNKDLPRHRWFYFKEGFSRDFVYMMLKKFKAKYNDWVLDPFMGVGTTPLTAREYGVNCIGIDVSPLFYMISDVKIRDYDSNEIKETSEWLLSQRYKPVDLNGVHPLLKKAFNIHNLRDIIFFRDKIMEIEEIPIRNFFLVALLNASSKVTLLWKEKSWLKPIERRNIPPFRKIFQRNIRNMIEDLDKLDLKKVSILLYQADARNMSMIEDGSIDYVITSPPYLNKIEYTRMYEVEYLLTYGDIKVNPIRSYIGIVPSMKKMREILDILPHDAPLAAKAYFSDMSIVLSEVYRVLKDGGRVALVVGQGVFPDRIIEADEILAEIAYSIGFRRPEIWIVNKRVVTRSRTIKIGYTRESIIFMRK